MASENNDKRVFPADIFAEDNDKWSWSAPSSNVKSSPGGVNHSLLRKIPENESESSRSSLEMAEDPNNVKVVEKSFRKRKSSSTSEGNQAEDSLQSSVLPHERVLPSMYDDDARSASPSAYEKRDLAYASDFHKGFNPLPPKNLDPGPFTPFDSKSDKSEVSEKESSRHSNKEASSSPNRSYKSESRKSERSRSSSKSRDKRQRGSRSRSHSRGRCPKSPVRERRRSRSRDRHSERERTSMSRSKRSGSKDNRGYRKRSLSRDSRRRSRDHRSRSRSRDYRRSRSRSFDKRRGRYHSSSRDHYRHRRYSHSRSRSRDRSKGRSGSGNRKPGSLPLSTPGGAMTPQMALQQTMAAMSAKAEALTGVAFPKYYNPAAVNPLKYAEQVQKRKLLWQKDTVKVEDPTKSSVWNKLQFAQDQDGKMTAKFRKLMGIKADGTPQEEEKVSVLKKQEDLFRDLDQQYEMARVTTHTQRGVGLGYSAQTIYPPVQK